MDEGADQKAKGGQAVDIDDIDESRIPTAPMRAVGFSGMPPIDFDDDDDDDEGPRPGTRDNPITSTTHHEIRLPEDQVRMIEARKLAGGPNMVMVALRVVLLLGVLAGVAFGILKVLR